MMPFYRNYSAPPTQPFALPISAHPPAAPCGPGARLAHGQFVNRGGVFEGAAMSQGQQRCGYWSDYVGEVPLSTGHGYGPGGQAQASLRTVRAWPPEAPSRFQPRILNLGYPTAQNIEHPTDALGNADVPGPMQPLADPTTRGRNIWTGPAGPQPGMTARGGVLDGNALATGQNLHAAYYTGESPRALRPVTDVRTIPNPRAQGPVPEIGWGVDGPEQQRRNYGAMESARPTALQKTGGAGANMAATVRQLGPAGGCPKAVSASVFGGRVPGGVIAASSIFRTPVRVTQGPVSALSTVRPAVRSVPAEDSCMALGYGPDGIG